MRDGSPPDWAGARLQCQCGPPGLIFLGIMILVNFLSARHHRRFDVTANRQNSLSPQTLKILNGLDRM